MMTRARVVDDVADLEPYVAAWDDLAVTAARPYCAPAWLLAWWRHASPPGARLRVVVVESEGSVIGVAPFYAESLSGGLDRLRPLAAGICSRVEPLAAPEQREAVAATVAAALDVSRGAPAVLAFEGVSASAGWHHLLAQAWPDGQPPRVRVLQSTPAPTVGLRGEGYEGWLGSKSRNFRQQMRRMRRQLEAAGARFRRIAAPAEVAERLPHMTALHRRRMEAKGERSRVSPAVERMLREAAERLAPAGRMWLWEARAPDGAAISSHLFVAAGGEVGYWLGGFDDAWAAHKPGLVALVIAVEDGFSRGDRRLDLGPGGQHYKRRLADGADELIEATLLPRTHRYPLARARLAPHELRRRVAIRMSPRRRLALRRLLRHPPPGAP